MGYARAQECGRAADWKASRGVGDGVVKSSFVITSQQVTKPSVLEMWMRLYIRLGNDRAHGQLLDAPFHHRKGMSWLPYSCSSGISIPVSLLLVGTGLLDDPVPTCVRSQWLLIDFQRSSYGSLNTQPRMYLPSRTASMFWRHPCACPTVSLNGCLCRSTKNA